MIDYYSPREIVFTRPQVEWLAPQLVLMKEGYYPPEPSNYTDIINKSRSNKAGYETPVEIAAELYCRMRVCGTDGMLAIKHYYYGIPIEQIAYKSYIDMDFIEKHLAKVVGYISSGVYRRWVDNKKRKGIYYKDWCKLYYKKRLDRVSV